MYSPEIVSNFTNPTHNGSIERADQVVETQDPVCGDRIEISLTIAAGRVSAARFQAWGCATSVAAANALCVWAEGKLLTEIGATPIESLSQLLGTVTPEQAHCVEILQSLARDMGRGHEI